MKTNNFSAFTATDLERLKKNGLIRDYNSMGDNAVKVARNKAKPHLEPKGIAYIKSVLEKHSINYEVEYKFSKRKFRFDIAVPQFMLACEYEGIFSGKSRHTTVGGYTKDCEKYNLAAICGWKVLRYTSKNYKDFNRDLVELLFKIKN